MIGRTGRHLSLVVFIVAGVASILLLGSRQVGAQSPAEWPDISLVPVVGGLEKPVHVTHAGDGSNRLFVVEQEGRIRVVKDGQVQSTPFLDIVDRVSCCGERGLLSVAFPPGYAEKGYFYVDYTDNQGDTVVARYYVAENPDVADPASEEVILAVDQPYTNHNGGQLAFGPNDGYLYIGLGDGGAGGDPEKRAQNPAELLGKILRIDVEQEAAPAAGRTVPDAAVTGQVYLPVVVSRGADPEPYRIPSSNPFAQTEGYRGEIWALGLRNPWRFSFDRETGDLYIGDVGQSQYEEVNFQPASSGGENYGWDILEGSHCYEPSTGCTPPEGYVAPVAEYAHGDRECAVTGGFVYRGQQYPGMQGIYFYGDYCSGRIWGLQRVGSRWESRLLEGSEMTITSFGEDQAGELYLADYGTGTIYQIRE